MDDSQYSTALSAFVCIALMVGMMVAFAIGRFAGIHHRRIDADGARTVSGAVEASIFGLLGLLIAFTFSGAADRFDTRRVLITDEANAVDAAYRSLDLLAATDRDALRGELRRYIDARIAYYAALPQRVAPNAILEDAERIEDVIWAKAVDAMPRGQPGCVAALTNSLNRMFEVVETRKMASLTHPPLAIYALLVFLALVCASLAGHHASQSARHPWVLPMLFAGISGLAIYVILDLEYPRAGFIRVDSADALLREVRAHMA